MKRFTLAVLAAVVLAGCSAGGGVGIGGGTGGLGLGAGLSFPVGGSSEKADNTITQTSYYAAFRDDALRAVNDLENVGDVCRMTVNLNRDGSVKTAHRTSPESEYCDAAVETIEGTRFAPPPANVTDQQIKHIPLNLQD